MDDPGIIKNIYAIARLAAELQVKREHFFPEPAPKAAAAGQPMDAAAPPAGDGPGLQRRDASLISATRHRLVLRAGMILQPALSEQP